jgi:hypothetical protein
MPPFFFCSGGINAAISFRSGGPAVGVGRTSALGACAGPVRADAARGPVCQAFRRRLAHSSPGLSGLRQGHRKGPRARDTDRDGLRSSLAPERAFPPQRRDCFGAAVRLRRDEAAVSVDVFFPPKRR